MALATTKRVNVTRVEQVQGICDGGILSFDVGRATCRFQNRALGVRASDNSLEIRKMIE